MDVNVNIDSGISGGSSQIAAKSISDIERSLDKLGATKVNIEFDNKSIRSYHQELKGIEKDFDNLADCIGMNARKASLSMSGMGRTGAKTKEQMSDLMSELAALSKAHVTGNGFGSDSHVLTQLEKQSEELSAERKESNSDTGLQATAKSLELVNKNSLRASSGLDLYEKSLSKVQNRADLAASAKMLSSLGGEGGSAGKGAAYEVFGKMASGTISTVSEYAYGDMGVSIGNILTDSINGAIAGFSIGGGIGAAIGGAVGIGSSLIREFAGDGKDKEMYSNVVKQLYKSVEGMGDERVQDGIVAAVLEEYESAEAEQKADTYFGKLLKLEEYEQGLSKSAGQAYIDRYEDTLDQKLRHFETNMDSYTILFESMGNTRAEEDHQYDTMLYSNMDRLFDHSIFNRIKGAGHSLNDDMNLESLWKSTYAGTEMEYMQSDVLEARRGSQLLLTRQIQTLVGEDFRIGGQNVIQDINRQNKSLENSWKTVSNELLKEAQAEGYEREFLNHYFGYDSPETYQLRESYQPAEYPVTVTIQVSNNPINIHNEVDAEKLPEKLAKTLADEVTKNMRGYMPGGGT